MEEENRRILFFFRPAAADTGAMGSPATPCLDRLHEDKFFQCVGVRPGLLRLVRPRTAATATRSPSVGVETLARKRVVRVA